jgi:hypothetical protein
MSRIEINDCRTDAPIFIHSELDDYGLTAIEFRVYARLARRAGGGGAFESVPSMAEEFEVSEKTVRRALRVLVACQLVGEQVRPGFSTIFTLLPRSEWLPKSDLKGVRTNIYGRGGLDTTDRGSPDTRDRGVWTPQTDEGNPNKSLSTRARENEIPDPAKHPANQVFAEVYEHPPHLDGQTKIATVVTNLDIWRRSLKRQKLNGTPAKNIGTLLEVYEERVQRETASPPAVAVVPTKTAAERSAEARRNWEQKGAANARANA